MEVPEAKNQVVKVDGLCIVHNFMLTRSSLKMISTDFNDVRLRAIYKAISKSGVMLASHVLFAEIN